MKRTVVLLSSWLHLQGFSASGSASGSAVAQIIDPTESSVEIDLVDILTNDGAESEVTPADEFPPRPYNPLRTAVVCPTDTAELTELMLRDLPNYTNRVLQRTVAVLPPAEADEQREREGEFVREPYRPSHVLIAGQANLTPLDLNDYTYTTSTEAGGPLKQVFFTTLSRQYFGLRDSEVQEYHWLFLTQTTDGWRRAFMFSSVDNAQSTRAALPPFESSGSSVGQAVQLWLRDCRAGAIASLETEQ